LEPHRSPSKASSIEMENMDRCGCSSETGAVPGRLGEAEPEGKALNLLVGLRSNPHLRSRTLGRDRDRNNKGRGYKRPK